MAPTASGEQIDELVGKVVEEYFQCSQRGEQPQLDEFVERYPEISDLLKTVIPALQVAEPTPDASAHDAVAREQPKQLGDFRILRQLGRGGMGIVYEAEQISMNRRVALKVLPLAGLVDELKIRRFQNEVRAVAALDHPNIVSVYMVGQERGVHYYAMQLIRGRSLSEVISSLRHVRDGGEGLGGSSMSQITRMGSVDDLAEEGEAAQSDPAASAALGESGVDQDVRPASVETVAEADSSTIPHSSRREYYRSVAALGIQAAAALQRAHEEGIIHRDVKPANLLLDGSSKLYLTDFGLARIESDAGVTMTGDLIGTLRYMAPEQALAKRVVVDHRADIYSLGATLYELLTLQPAYLADDRQQLMKQIAFEEPTRLRRVDADIPGELETIVHKAMSKDMDQRYSSAQELADDLRSHLENRPITAKPPTLVQTLAKWTRRNTILTWASIITLSIVTLTLAASTLLVSRQLVRAATAESEAKRAGEQSASRADELARHNYLMHVANADKAVLEDRALRAQVELDACRPEQRGWEWDYLVQRMQETFPHVPSFSRGVFTRDGSRMIGLGSDGTSEPSFFGVWELESGNVVNELRHDSRLTVFVVSTNGLWIACFDVDGRIVVWDVKSGKKTMFDHKHVGAKRGENMAISPDGRLLAWSSRDGRVVIVVDVADGKEQYRLGPFQESNSRVVFSPDGRWIACGTEYAETPVMLVNAATGETVAQFSEEGGDQTVAFAPGGQQIVAGTVDGLIKVWSWDGNELSEKRSWRASQRAILGIAFDTDGTRLVSSDRMNNVTVWDFITEKPLAILGVKGEVFGLAFRPRANGRPSGDDIIAMGSPSSGLVLWRWRGGENGTTVRPLDGAAEATFSPDGQFILASTPMYFTGGNLYYHQHHYYPPESASVLSSQSGREVATIDEAIYAATWSPDGQEIIATPAATTASGDVIRTYDAATGEPLHTYPGGRGRFTVSRISPNGERLVSFSSDKTIRTLDFESGEELRARHINIEAEFALFRGMAAHFSPDTRLIGLATLDAEVWDTRRGTRVSRHSQPRHWAKRFAFSKDGNRVYVGSSGGLLTQLDTETGKETKRFVGHSGYVLGIAIAPDEKQIVSGDRIGRVIVWDVASEQPLVTLTDGDQRITSLDWSSDGRRIVAGKEDGSVQIWTLPRSR